MLKFREILNLANHFKIFEHLAKIRRSIWPIPAALPVVQRHWLEETGRGVVALLPSRTGLAASKI